MTETVLTSRRALLLPPAGRPVRGRLRLSDRSVRFVPADGLEAVEVEVEVEDLTRLALRRGRRGALRIQTATTVLQVRCFGLRGVAGLLLHARTG